MEELLKAVSVQDVFLYIMIVVGTALLNGVILFSFQVVLKRIIEAQDRRQEKRENYITTSRMTFLDQLEKLYEALTEYFQAYYAINAMNIPFAPFPQERNEDELDVYLQIIGEERRRYGKIIESGKLFRKMEDIKEEIRKYYKLHTGSLGRFSDQYKIFSDHWDQASRKRRELMSKKELIQDDGSIAPSLELCKTLSTQYEAFYEAYQGLFDQQMSSFLQALLVFINNVRNYLF